MSEVRILPKLQLNSSLVFAEVVGDVKTIYRVEKLLVPFKRGSQFVGEREYYPNERFFQVACPSNTCHELVSHTLDTCIIR